MNRGNSFANGNSMNGGAASQNGTLPSLVKNSQAIGVTKPATIWDHMEPPLIF